MFNASGESQSSCTFTATSQDGNLWMSSPCWDLKTVYAPAMPAASNNCLKWPKYSNLSKLDKSLAQGVKISLTPAQQKSPERGYCTIENPGTGLCKWSLESCASYIKSLDGKYDQKDPGTDGPLCEKGQDTPGGKIKYLRCLCPATFTKKFPDTPAKDTLCQNPESINAVTSWMSVFLAATPDLNGEQGLLQSACSKNGKTLLTPDCVAQYITAPNSKTIQKTNTHYFSENYYAWLLQFLYYDGEHLLYPNFDSSEKITEITDTDKSDYLSGFGPTYVFPFSDFVSGDKALLTWGDLDSSSVEIKLNYNTGEKPSQETQQQPLGFAE